MVDFSLWIYNALLTKMRCLRISVPENISTKSNIWATGKQYCFMWYCAFDRKKTEEETQKIEKNQMVFSGLVSLGKNRKLKLKGGCNQSNKK